MVTCCRLSLLAFVLLLFSQSIYIAESCSVLKLLKPEEIVSDAYAIVRAKAVNYDKKPENLNITTNGIPDSIIRFQIEEIIKGDSIESDSLLINGYLTKDDDFNHEYPPYTFVRPGGATGSCFANFYKQGASFLLFLNKDYSPYWGALAPVNEQLHSPPHNDLWLRWVKKQVCIAGTAPMVVSGASKLRTFFF